MVEKSLASTEWQSVEDGSGETLRNVEIGGAFLARIGAARILGREVVPRAADVAGGVERLGPCVGNQGVQVVAKALGQFGAEGIVIPGAVGTQILDSRSPPFRIGQALRRR